MKKLNFLFILSLLFSSFSLSAQYAYDDTAYDDSFYPGYLGDNFSLEGALEIFKDARSVEAFEFDLNNEGRYVNNLDLNNDGRIDFIRVTDQSQNRNVRLIVMQAVLGRDDVQDVAVIAVEKNGRRSATLQIIGDEYLYGPDMIVEPSDIQSGQSRYDRGPNADVILSRFYVNVWYWPSVRSLFRSRYTYYRSPYYWDSYPVVWNPWRPYGYSTYYDRCGRYRTNFYRVAPRVRIVYVTNYYRPNRRVCSVRVRDRYERNRPYYRNNRNDRGDRGRDDRNRSDRYSDSPRGDRSGTGGRVNDGGGRTYTQTKPERRSNFDSKREKQSVVNSSTRGAAAPNKKVQKERAAVRSDVYSPKKEVRKETRAPKYDKPTRDVRTSEAPSRASKYDRPKKETRTESYSKRPETRQPAKKTERSRGSSSYSKPAPSKSSRGSSSYDRPKKSSKSSSSKSRSGSYDSGRKSNSSSSSKRSSSASKKSSPAPKASRSKSATKAKVQNRSKSSSSKGSSKKSSKRGF